MNEKKENKQIKKISLYNNWVHIIIGIIFAIFALLTLKSFTIPYSLEKSEILNKVNENSDFNFKVEVIPCTLYPSGGTIDPKGIIMTKITKSLQVSVNYKITSESCVKLKGNQMLNLRLIADKLWERNFPFYDETQFELEGKENEIIKGDYFIDLQTLYAYIENVEKETGTRPENYYLKIQPIINGSIYYEDMEKPIEFNPEVTFDMGYGNPSITGDTTFENNVSFERKSTVHNNFNLFKTSVPLKTARYLFLFISIILLILLFLKLKESLKIRKTKVIKEFQVIDKKYKGRLIYIKDKINLTEKTTINVESIKALISLADERELPILRLENEGSVLYYIADGEYIFSYTSDIKEIIISHKKTLTF